MDSNAAAFALEDVLTCSARLVRRAQQLPPVGARPVTISGRVAGWIAPRALEAIRTLPGVDIEDEAVHIRAASTGKMGLEAVLRGVAQTLQAAGCIRAWRDEQVDVVAEGRCLSSIERGATRPLGLLTQAVHLNAWAPDGRLWVARRSLNKPTDPGLWDTLSGGLVSAGEDLETALLRESHEEAGLPAVALAGHAPLRTVVRMHRRLPDGYQVENVMVSDCVLDPGTVPQGLDGEVMEFKCLAAGPLWDLLTQGAFTLEAELCVLDSLRHRLQAPSASATSARPSSPPLASITH